MELSMMNVIYQTSLHQFLGVFAKCNPNKALIFISSYVYLKNLPDYKKESSKFIIGSCSLLIWHHAAVIVRMHIT